MDVPEEQIYSAFREKIRELALLDEEDVGQLWDDASEIRSLAKKILSLPPGVQEADHAEVQEPPANSNAEEIFRWIHHYAVDIVMARAEDRHEDLVAAAQSMISATRRVEELLEPELQTEIVNSESAVFTHNTKPSHLDAPLALSATVETMSQGQAEALDLLEQSAGGAIEAEMQELEHSWRVLQNQHRGQDHPDTAAMLHNLGVLSRQAGDLPSAKQHLEESLRMKRSMHGDRDHPDIAVILHALGQLSLQAGDLPAAKQQMEESLRMKRSTHGDRDHPDIAATLHALGQLSRQAGDLPLAKQHLEESLRMERSTQGDRDHSSISAALHELGLLSLQAGDLPAAKKHLEESLRMNRSMHGDRDHSSISAALHELGLLSLQAGDLPLAKQHLEESLRMERSLHGDRDHPGIAATLHELGVFESTG